jgi:CBS domain containing-hemolysin-like protein
MPVEAWRAGPALAALALLLLTPLLLTLSALLERSGPIRLRHWTEIAGKQLRAVFDAPARWAVFRFLLGFLGRMALVGLFLAFLHTLLHFGLPAAELGSLALVTIVAALNELLNRTLVTRDPENALRRLTWVYRGALVLLWPLVALIAPLVPAERLLRREDPDPEVSEEEIEAFIDVGTREGILEPEERELVRGIVDFGEAVVRSVMTPRIDMTLAPVDAGLEALADRFVDSQYSRIPLYHDSRDQIVGIVYLRDLLRGLRSAEPPAARDLMRPPYFVPETKPVNELLREFQGRGIEMAIVRDEHGSPAGLATGEDLLEEIVGEISDEADELVPEREEVGEGVWRLAGSAHVDALQDLFGIEIGETPYETIGGLVLTAAGTVPKVGDVVEALGLKLTVEAVDRRRIKRVKVERVAPAVEEAPARA